MTTRTKTTTSTNEQSTIIGSTNNGILSINGTIPLNGKGIEIGNYAMVSMDTYSCTVVFVLGVNMKKRN